MQQGDSLGAIIDSLGVESAALDDDELVSDAIVLLKIVQPNGDVVLRSAFTPGTSWIERSGMLRIAERIELSDLTDASGP